MKMKIAALALMASVLHAHAQTADFYVLKDQSSPQKTLQMGIYTANGKSAPVSISSDASGNPLSGAAGTTNPNGTGLYIQGVTGGVPVSTTIGGTLPAFSSPPTVNLGTLNGAATSALQSSILAAIGSPLQAGGSVGISGTLPSFASVQHFICDSGCAGGGGGGTSSNFNSAFPAAGTAIGVSNGTNMVPITLGQALSAVSLPVVLPAAQITALTPPTSVGISGTLPAFAATPTVNIGTAPTISVTGTFFQATQPVSAASLPLPSGAATAAAQTTGNASLSSIDGKTPALGQALAAASVPIVLTAAQLTTLTPPAAINGFATAANQTNASQKTQLVDGAGAVIGSTSNALNVNVINGGSGGTSSTFGATFPTVGTAAGMSQGGLMVAMTGTSGNLNVQCANCSGSGVSTADGAAFTAGSSLFAGAGGIVQTTATSNPVTAGDQGLFQMTANRALFTNLRNSSGVEIGNSAAPVFIAGAGSPGSAVNGVVTIQGIAAMTPVQVSQATAANLNATVVGTGTFAVQAAQSGAYNITNISGTISLPTGAATQTTSAAILTALGSPFQAGGSIGNTAFGATQSGTWNITNISGTVSLPTGASIASNQTAVQAPVAAGTATATKSELIGAQFLTTQPTISNTQQASLLTTNRGELLVSPGVSGFPITLASTTITGSVTVAQGTGSNLHMVCDSGCSGSGGTSSTFGSTMPTLGTAIGLYDGTNMVRAKGDETNGLWVNVKTAVGAAIGSTTSGSTGSLIMGAVQTSGASVTNGNTNPLSLDVNSNLRVVFANTTLAVTNAGTFATQAAQSGSWADTVSSATAPVSTMNSASANSGVTAANAFAFDDVSPTSITENSFGYARISANRNQYHTLRDAAGNERGQNVNVNNAALVAIDQTTAGGNATTQVASASGGASQFHLIAAASNNSTLVSTGAHNLYAAQMGNNSANIAYLKIYNKATAPTCGTDTPVKTLIIPASTSGAGSNVQIDIGSSVALGLGICVTGGIADNDNTSVAAAAFAINLDYK